MTWARQLCERGEWMWVNSKVSVQFTPLATYRTLCFSQGKKKKKAKVLDTGIYNKYIFGLHPIFGPELLKPLQFPQRWNQQMCLLLMDFWTTPKVQGLLPRENNREIRGLELSYLPPCPLGRVEGLEAESLAKDQWCHQSCLYNDASIKSPRTRFGELPD